jgi:hypothetical protein
LGWPTLGLAGLFLIQIEETPALNFPRPVAVDGDGAAAERRSRERTRVHSLALITFSTKVVGASTGILIPGQIGLMECGEERLGDRSLAERGSGDASSHDVQRRASPHSRSLVRWTAFLRHCLNPRASAEELSERFEQGGEGEERKEGVPTGSPADNSAGDSPAGSNSGEDVSQNRPGRRSNVSPHITALFVAQVLQLILWISCTKAMGLFCTS